jgi:hypothetical protein
MIRNRRSIFSKNKPRAIFHRGRGLPKKGLTPAQLIKGFIKADNERLLTTGTGHPVLDAIIYGKGFQIN